MKIIVGNHTGKFMYENGVDNFEWTPFIQKVRDCTKQKIDDFDKKRHFMVKDNPRLATWDGYTQYVTLKGVFKVGLLPLLYNGVLKLPSFVSEFGVLNIEFIDERTNIIQFVPPSERTDVLDTEFTLRGYQYDVVQKIINNKVGNLPFYSGIIDVVVNGGKTTGIMTGLLANMSNPKVLFLVDRQLVQRDALLPAIQRFHEVGQISQKVFDVQDITIGMAQTVHRALKDEQKLKELQRFECVIVDESHRAGSTTYNDILESLQASTRLFFSGTALSMSCPVRKMNILAYSGTPIAKVTRAVTEAQGVSLKPLIKWKVINDPKYMAGVRATIEVKQRQFSSHWVNVVYDIIKEQDKFTLIYFQNRAHGEFIYKSLKQLGVDCEWTHGKDLHRDSRIRAFENKKFGTFICSSIIKEGLNIPHIQVIIRMDAGKSPIVLEQVIGRGVRADGKNTHVDIWDFGFVHDNWGRDSIKRKQQYAALGYEIELVD